MEAQNEDPTQPNKCVYCDDSCKTCEKKNDAKSCTECSDGLLQLYEQKFYDKVSGSNPSKRF